MDNNQNNGRREFVKQSSLIAGGLLAAPFLSNANFFSGADDVIKIALIGCGGRGTGAAMQALLSKQNVKLVAMADAFSDRLESCYKTITSKEVDEGNNLSAKIDVPAERRFTGFDAYLKAIPLADVVILTTPPGFRPIHFEEAIKQNKHVFMEKPVATDPAGIKKVLDTAEIAKQKKMNVVVG
jgi:predicted dehydrogenase